MGLGPGFEEFEENPVFDKVFMVKTPES